MQHITAYNQLLEQEMRLWSQLDSLAQRRVSTVHFGGGTPTFLNGNALRELVQHCRAHFDIDGRTEWALESTASDLTDEMFGAMNELGFTRLHIGVQSLEDPVRQLLNRREPAQAVLEKIYHALALGWIVSVDLIYGLPQQSLIGFMRDIAILADAGVDGFSLYELQSSPRNRKFIERCNVDRLDRSTHYLLFQAASHRLTALGYQKSLFNHFARTRDTDLYFTFPERAEDCLALGTIADGVLGDYHYRHSAYPEYCKSVDAEFPGLEGGLRRNALENRIQPLEVAVLSGTLNLALFEKQLGTDRAKKLFQEWQESALIEEHDSYFLSTANGSWFAGEMMAQLAG